MFCLEIQFGSTSYDVAATIFVMDKAFYMCCYYNVRQLLNSKGRRWLCIYSQAKYINNLKLYDRQEIIIHKSLNKIKIDCKTN